MFCFCPISLSKVTLQNNYELLTSFILWFIVANINSSPLDFIFCTSFLTIYVLPFHWSQCTYQGRFQGTLGSIPSYTKKIYILSWQSPWYFNESLFLKIFSNAVSWTIWIYWLLKLSLIQIMEIHLSQRILIINRKWKANRYVTLWGVYGLGIGIYKCLWKNV